MNRIQHDIDDDEIRIISSAGKPGGSPSRKGTRRRKRVATVVASVVAIIIAAVCAAVAFHRSDEAVTYTVEESTACTDSIAEASQRAVGYVEKSDTVVNGFPLSVLRPVNATPTLHIGTDVLGDSSVILAVQAADVREDNGGIVGAFVVNGELMSKGRAKSGFCAIIDGELTIGVADATPLLEQALESNGCFFRQYPLVVANQVVENKPKGASLRKALAELNGRPAVIISGERMTFHDFSQSLADLGVSNAIYLVGGASANGYAVDSCGSRIWFGRVDHEAPANTNYIIWR